MKLLIYYGNTTREGRRERERERENTVQQISFLALNYFMDEDFLGFMQVQPHFHK
jgi:hypothetical protein